MFHSKKMFIFLALCLIGLLDAGCTGTKPATEATNQSAAESEKHAQSSDATSEKPFLMMVLPSELFLSHPGFRLDQSVEYLAKIVYPEIYDHAQ